VLRSEDSRCIVFFLSHKNDVRTLWVKDRGDAHRDNSAFYHRQIGMHAAAHNGVDVRARINAVEEEHSGNFCREEFGQKLPAIGRWLSAKSARLLRDDRGGAEHVKP